MNEEVEDKEDEDLFSPDLLKIFEDEKYKMNKDDRIVQFLRLSFGWLKLEKEMSYHEIIDYVTKTFAWEDFTLRLHLPYLTKGEK